MPEYLLELYVSQTDASVAVDLGERARAAAEELTRRGTAVRYQCLIFVPEEETCFVLFGAACADAVRVTARLAALPCERISTAITHPGREAR
ncbi:MAG TPA: hypothetical protein VGF93_20715 [Solirubrobacteraceae bacterium]|jgi:hypothetical protein